MITECDQEIFEIIFDDNELGVKCVMCGKLITGFRNEISLREFYISRMCQKCMDKIFGVD